MKTIITIIAALLLSLTISAQNTITTDSILQLSTCAGGNVVVPFKATGNYSFGNYFIAQLSNGFGQYTNPVNIGQMPVNLGLIYATIPKSTNFSIFYKIRVISTNPADTGSPCPNSLIITQVAQLNQIIAMPNDTICQGNSTTLTAINLASSYQWSTGDTTQSITVTQAGTYSVTTTDLLTCQSDTSIVITMVDCSGMNEYNLGNSINVSPNPASEILSIKYEVKSKKNEGRYMVYDEMGQMLLTCFFAKEEFQINISNLARGMYFLKIEDENGVAVKRFVKE